MDNTEPKPGVETSSFKVLIVSTFAPIILFIGIIVGLIFIKEPDVRQFLIQALYVVGAGVLGSAAIGWKYVEKRGEVSVAKVGAKGSATTTTVNIDQTEKG